MLPITTQEMKFRKGPLYIVAAIFVLYEHILFDTGRLSDAKALLVGGILLAVIMLFYFMSKLKLVIDNDGITHERFFRKPAALQWADVKSSYLAWHYHGHGANLSWEFTSYSGQSLNITPSFYSRKNLRLLAEAVVLKCPQAVIDKRIINIAGGKYPWYIF